MAENHVLKGTAEAHSSRGEPNTALHTPPSSSSISTSIPRVPLMPASTDRQITMGDLGIGQKSPSLPPAPPMPPGIATPQSAATLSGSRSFAQSNSNPVDTSARAPADASASPNNPTPLATTEGGHICGIPLSSLYFFTDGVTQWP
ncbi:hypothetical protein MMC10_000453 [Thelotrema lepadinum]|nr:hypothetical protein [Thelotrema lepadinum]